MNVEVFRTACASLRNQCYLVHHAGQGILIDPAWDFMLIDNFMTARRISLLAVLITHAHPDHTNLAERFAEKYGCSIYMSLIEKDLSGFQCTNLTVLEDLQELIIGHFKAMPLLTPGHSPGSMCYLIGDHLFTGDTVFIEGVGICHGASAAAELFDSVQKIKASVQMTTLIWPGHSFGIPPGQTLQHLMEHNIYFQLAKPEHFIKFRTRKNRPDPFAFK